MTRLFNRIGFAFKCFFLVLFAGRLPDRLPPEYLRTPPTSATGVSTVETPPATRARPPGSAAAASTADQGTEADRAVQLLALLQRDGRLVDFLWEDLGGYPDDQVGAAAREVHASCRQVLQRYLALEPLMSEEEGRPAIVNEGFDPAVIRVVGQVAGRPPFHGVVRHRGWRATRIALPPLADGAARSVVAPAEVEVV